ncbi:MAG: hypothetical protein P1U41_02445 [Vicingaceae bacterium]|nr:hypothetical protein [Vicingaceae bacterium]
MSLKSEILELLDIYAGHERIDAVEAKELIRAINDKKGAEQLDDFCVVAVRL